MPTAATNGNVADSADYNPHTAAAQKWSDDRTIVLPLGENGMCVIDVDSGAEHRGPPALQAS